MPNTPNDQEQLPGAREDEDGGRERGQFPGRGPRVPEDPEDADDKEPRDDRRDDRERDGLQVRSRLDPTRYVL